MTAPRKFAHLENGKPHFRFFHRGNGVYEVYVARAGERERGDDVLLGQIRTVAPIARGEDPGRWRVVRADDQPFDSMDAAAEVLLNARLDAAQGHMRNAA